MCECAYDMCQCFYDHVCNVCPLTHAADAIQSSTERAANKRLRGVILDRFVLHRLTKSRMMRADPMNDKAAVNFGVITRALSSFSGGSMIVYGGICLMMIL